MAALVLPGPLGPGPVLASTAVVPDEYSTVQSAIDSGVDSVLIRAGTYPERPLVDHAVVLQGVEFGPRPRLDGLNIVNSNFWAIPRLLNVSRLAFSGRVEYRTLYVHPRNLQFSFSDCSLDSGVQVLNYDTQDVGSLVIRNSHLRGRSTAGADVVSMEADTVDGGVSWGSGDVGINGCWFRGGSGAAIDLNWGTLRGVSSHNRIEHYDTGVSVENIDDTHRIEENVIRECGVGMRLGAGYGVEVLGNDIQDCGIGIDVRWLRDVQIVGNTILRAGGDGVVAQVDDVLLAERNVVGDCSGAGIVVEWGYWAYRGVLSNNTIFNNAGSGMKLTSLPGYAGAAVRNNIGFGNLGWGLTVPAAGVVNLGCNDWFGNGLGAVSGVAADSTDLSVDPLFCNVHSADVRLDSASPVLGVAGCGQIGALGVGCGVTATLVQRFTAERVSDGIRIIWQVAERATASQVWLERSESSSGEPWVRPVTERSVQDRPVVELDRSAVVDRAYWYRLVALEGNDARVIGSPIFTEAEALPMFRLTEVGPNPGGGRMRIGFSLEHTAAVEIDIFDVQGRRVASPSRDVWPAGAHAVDWDGRTRSGEPAPAGMYVVRYLYPGGRDRRAIVRIR